MEVDFAEILNEDSSDEESVLSDDAGFASDASEYETDIEEKFIPAAEIRALNGHTKYCMIQSYYTTGGPLTVCAACIVLLADIDTVEMHYIKKHSINYIDALNSRSCTNCRVALYTIFPCNKCPQTHQEWSYCTQGAECSICEEPMYTVFPQHVSTLYTLKKLLSAPCKSECFAWLQRCDECIERLEELCRDKRPRLTVRHRQSVVARIARLAGAVINYNHIAFNGDFVTKDKRANKSINTKNSECLHYFGSSAQLEIHSEDCQKMNDCAIRLPSGDDRWFEFDNHNNQERVPFIVYADLECVLRKTEPDTTIRYHRITSVAITIASRGSRDSSTIWRIAKKIFLEKLASYLDKDKLKIVRSEFSTLSDEEFDLLTRKGIIALKKPFYISHDLMMTSSMRFDINTTLPNSVHVTRPDFFFTII
ncbi:hypothetical protein ALC57_18296 [Trachymyrmex cornetzi]|uniref:Uncharacterized protein n=1 Tax=Trachymyrmex cornetzi TaxID=471704 RepID=A0A151ISC7_9HYME|nr:hypothetical protein ALC57_18296 [Trachymyrmex cornetzi]